MQTACLLSYVTLVLTHAGPVEPEVSGGGGALAPLDFLKINTKVVTGTPSFQDPEIVASLDFCTFHRQCYYLALNFLTFLECLFNINEIVKD